MLYPPYQDKKEILLLKNLTEYKIAVRTIPEITDLAKGEKLITEFLDLDKDDLLGRIEVEPFESLMKKNILTKTILVTGSGGSIGSELCRQIIKLNPKRILLIDISEYALYSIHSELDQIKNSKIELIPLIASIQDSKEDE